MHRRIHLVVLVLLAFSFAQLQAQSTKHSKASDKKPSAAESTAAKLDLNTASQKDLEALPGVGAATAKKIIAGRPYSSPSDLSKAGISAKTIDKISPMVIASGSSASQPSSATTSRPSAPGASTESSGASSEPTKSAKRSSEQPAAGSVDLNTASQKDLEALPGVGAATAKKIIAGRPYSSTSDLSKAGISAKTIDKISPMVTVSGANASSASSSSSPASSPRKSRRANTDTSSSSGSIAAPPTVAPPAQDAGRATAAPSSEPNASTDNASPDTKVWVNKDTKIYHLPGDHWYGKTKNGEYMSLSDAEKAGYRASKKK